MNCPSCGARFKRLSSWPLAAGRNIVCPQCGTACKRQGRWKPLIIAVVMLLLFQQFIGMLSLTGFGTILLLIGLVLLSMSIDEATIRLVPAGTPEESKDEAPKA